MSEPIKPGDLVQVVRWPCCGHYLGFVMLVQFLSTVGENGHCVNCGAKDGPYMTAGDDKNDFPLPWLKRIPPLSELNDVKRDEEITA